MRESIQRFHLDVLSYHQSEMFDTLIYKHDLITDTSKKYLLLERKMDKGNQPVYDEWEADGYLAIKEVNGEKIKYFLQKDNYQMLPVRVLETNQLFLQDSTRVKSTIYMITSINEFKLIPENCFPDHHAFIDSIAPFEHSNPDGWTLMKLIAIQAYVGKTFIGISSLSEFGKSSIFEVLHSITKKSVVFLPRSTPGILAQFNIDGNMVFEECCKVGADVKNVIENIVLQVGGNKPVYINGALQSHHTKPKYDVSGQSITFLYNVYSYYKKPDEEFFDYLFGNNEAIDSRLLKLKFDGKLTEVFDKEFDMPAVAKANDMFYKNIAKQLLYFKELKKTNAYKRRYTTIHSIDLLGRKKIIFNELTWIIDLYAKDQNEYNKFVALLEKAICDYQLMLGNTIHYAKQVTLGDIRQAPNDISTPTEQDINSRVTQQELVTEVETIEDVPVNNKDKLIQFLTIKKEATYEEIDNFLKIADMSDLDKLIKDMKHDGDIFECMRGVFKLL